MRCAVLASSLIVAAFGCDQRVEVLTVERDAGTDAAVLQCASCSDDAVCSNGECVNLPDVSSIAAGNDHTCLISAQLMYCAGSNASGQLGTNDTNVRVTPVRVRWGEQWFAVAAGARHTCGLRGADGRGTLHCWGSNENGQLGYVPTSGGQRSRSSQTRVGELSDWTQLECGGDTCCALRENAALYCWGANAEGSAGQTSPNNVASPTRVAPDHTFTPFFSVGTAHVCAIRTDKALMCWGKNASGQLGTGASRDPQRTPAEVPGAHDWLRIAAGAEHTCGIRGDHELSCWGSNSMAQTGSDLLAPDGEPISMTDTPGPVALERHWARISASGYHTCALRDSRDAFCWGGGNLGQLGSGVTKTQSVPTKVARGLKWRELGLGRTHSCGVVGESAAAPTFYCWGDNDSGKLGIGDTMMPRDTPAALAQ